MSTEHNTWYNKVFSAAYDPFMSVVEKNALSGRRKLLLENLSGKILEVGCGTGINFGLYGTGADVLALEPSEAMRGRALQNLAAAAVRANIRVEPWLLEDKEVNESIAAGSLDAAVCTLVLCTVPDPAATLGRLRQLLKPAGKLVILEHVRAKGDAGQWAQNFMNPFWRHLAEGCQLNRDTHSTILAAGFKAEDKSDFDYGLPFISGIYVSA